MVSRPRRSRLVLALACLCLAVGLVGLAGTVAAQEAHVLYLEVDDIITPVIEGYIARGVERAEEGGAELVVIRLDTPGGLVSSTYKIVEHLLNAEVPTAVFVAPRGAFAASAGTFITAAANIAVMTPGTNIGAATPVGGEGQDLPSTLASKAANDAAARMRSTADVRGRNAEKLEATVLEAASYSANEAVELNVVDLIASDLEDLLGQLDGWAVTIPGGEVVLETQGLLVRPLEMSLVERFLAFLSDPNVVFLLFSLGSLGLVVEMWNPGLIAPGVVGAILVILAFVGFGNLPVNWAGVALLGLAGALLVLEVYVAGFGVLGVGAGVSFVLGALLLFFHTGTPSPTMPSIAVSLWVLVPTAVVLIGGGGWVVLTIVRSRRPSAPPAEQALVGVTGHVTSDLAPRGTVRLRNELWTAVGTGREVIPTGREVRVVEVSGTQLIVAPVSENDAPTGGGRRPRRR